VQIPINPSTRYARSGDRDAQNHSHSASTSLGVVSDFGESVYKSALVEQFAQREFPATALL
jgi:hypothetical protein